MRSIASSGWSTLLAWPNKTNLAEYFAVESAPKTLLMQQQAVTNLQNADYADISTKLYTLKSAADALRSFSLYAGQPTATSGDSTKLTASATSARACSSCAADTNHASKADGGR